METELTLVQKLLASFELKCKKCGSTNVNGYSSQGADYGGETGYCPGTLSLGCNDCNNNDIYESL